MANGKNCRIREGSRLPRDLRFEIYFIFTISRPLSIWQEQSEDKGAIWTSVAEGGRGREEGGRRKVDAEGWRRKVESQRRKARWMVEGGRWRMVGKGQAGWRKAEGAWRKAGG